MQRSDLQEEAYQDLLLRILDIIKAKGLKSTTMDSVAAHLGMSKRTLYEIFDSKNEMIKEALAALNRQSKAVNEKAFANSDNVMEALLEIFKYNRDLVGSVNVNFYKDMDRLYKDNREDYEQKRAERYQELNMMFNLGVKQGMFRPDADFEVLCSIMALQMEGLKRMETHFPPGMSLQRVFDAIIVSFLRSIASENGLKILENVIKDLNR